MNKIAPYYKAVAGFGIPFLGSIGVALTAASDGGTSITAGEWVGAVVVGLISGGTVWGVPNKDPEIVHQDESVQPPQL